MIFLLPPHHFQFGDAGKGPPPPGSSPCTYSTPPTTPSTHSRGSCPLLTTTACGHCALPSHFSEAKAEAQRDQVTRPASHSNPSQDAECLISKCKDLTPLPWPSQPQVPACCPHIPQPRFSGERRSGWNSCCWGAGRESEGSSPPEHCAGSEGPQGIRAHPAPPLLLPWDALKEGLRSPRGLGSQG